MTDDELLERFRSLRTFRRGDQRAPHKPLLLLLAIRRLEDGSPRLVPYVEHAAELPALLAAFGSLREFRGATPAQTANPFWRLQGDGVWEVRPGPPELEADQSGAASDGRLRAAGAVGGFTEEIAARLLASPVLRSAVVGAILSTAFPDTIHDDVLAAAGLAGHEVVRRRRDPTFRIEVTRAYEHQCAVCSFEVSLEGRSIGIEAAHIRWHQARGPDVVSNGLCLCPSHHVCFDRGAWTVADDATCIVSDQAHGHDGFRRSMLAFHGRPLRLPIHPEDRPSPEHLAWHRAEVFRGVGRPRPRPLAS
jgi:putative restriction endonuclease